MALLKNMMFTHTANGHMIVAASLDTALALGLCEEHQQLYLWVVDSCARLGRVNVKTGTTEAIARLGIAMEEISFNSRGYLLGTAGRDLYRINPRTGALNLLTDARANSDSSSSFQRSASAEHSSQVLALGGSGHHSLVGAFRSDASQTSAQPAFDLARLFLKLHSVEEDNLVQLAILDGRTLDVGIFGYGTIYGRAKSNISRFQLENPGIYTTNSLTGRATTLAEHPRQRTGALAESGV